MKNLFVRHLALATISRSAEDETGAAPAPAAAPAVVKDAQNGITRPSEGTVTRRVWDLADGISTTHQRPALREEVMAAGLAEGINRGTIATQYARWTTYYGVSAEVRKAAREAATGTDKAAKEALKAEKAAERAAAKEAKEALKAAKAAAKEEAARAKAEAARLKAEATEADDEAPQPEDGE